ncbi:hypothetical protein [Krasilnikovia sp. MM14-A1259]|uniref:COG1470 family protein n=1 Tax=Krasilnikovia sp. MM14-A1259 TaxID=3373539 RepID=UPI00399C6082
MGVSVALSAESLEVVPGEEAVCAVTVRNTGTVIDQITMDVVGPAAAWSVVEPAVLNLYPGDVGEIRVHLRPPRASQPGAGKLRYGVRATSLEDPKGSATAEGVLEIAPFTELRVKLVPQISRGSRKGKHKIDVSNLGNVAVGTQIGAVDPDDALTFDVPRPAVVASPGVVTQAKLTAVPRRKFWTGKQQTKPFQVVVQPERGPASTVDGTFEQDPIVPRWAAATAIAALALAVVLAGLWFTLVKPAVHSAATEAVDAAASKAAAESGTDNGGGSSSGAASDVSASPSPSTSAPAKPAKKPEPGSPGNPLLVSTAFRIQTSAKPGDKYQLFKFPDQPANKPLDVTDLQLQNGASDTGFLEIRRGTEVVYSAGLDNFRDLSLPFVTPIRFAKGQKVIVAIQCLNPAPEKRPCTAAVTVSGKTS